MQQSQNLDMILDIFVLHTPIHSTRKSYWQKLMTLKLHPWPLGGLGPELPRPWIFLWFLFSVIYN